MTSKEERKRLLIEMMKEDEKNGMYEQAPLNHAQRAIRDEKGIVIGFEPFNREVPSKEETQLRSAEEIFNEVMEWHGITLSKYCAERRCALEAAELYASQFKPSGVKTFTVEDMRRCWDCAKDIDRSKFLDFDTWFKCQIWTKP